MTNDELLLAISDMMDKKLDARLNPMENNLRFLKDEVRQIKLFQEGAIMLRLQNIESCYTDTYKRYQSGIEQIEAMQADIGIMKSVIRAHSDSLQERA